MDTIWDWKSMDAAPKDRPIVVCDGVGGIHSVQWGASTGRDNNWYAFNGGWVARPRAWTEYPLLPWQRAAGIIDIGETPDAILNLNDGDEVLFQGKQYQFVVVPKASFHGAGRNCYFRRVCGGWRERSASDEARDWVYHKGPKTYYSFFRHIRIPHPHTDDGLVFQPAINSPEEFVEAIKANNALGDA